MQIGKSIEKKNVPVMGLFFISLGSPENNFNTYNKIKGLSFNNNGLVIPRQSLLINTDLPIFIAKRTKIKYFWNYNKSYWFYLYCTKYFHHIFFLLFKTL